MKIKCQYVILFQIVRQSYDQRDIITDRSRKSHLEKPAVKYKCNEQITGDIYDRHHNHRDDSSGPVRVYLHK